MTASSRHPSEVDRVIFIHIPKAAGRTVHSIVARQYSGQEILAVLGRLGETPPLVLEDVAGKAMVIGLVHHGVHQQLPGSSTYATLLREPVSRVLSLYGYALTNPNHYLHDRAVEEGLIGFLSSEAGAEEIENGQTRQIAGVTECLPDESSLAKAKDNLKTSFSAVGLVERFDESMVLFKRRFGWKMPFYVRKNVVGKQTPYEITDEALQIIKDRNALDAELYSFAQGLFEVQLREEGHLFNVEVALFRVLNSLARLYRGGRELARFAMGREKMRTN
jgi:hypothetical protein